MHRSTNSIIATFAMAAVSIVVAVVVAQPASQPAGDKVVTPSGLTIITTARGQGAQNNDTIFVLYSGKLTNGKIFDASSRHNNEPISFKLGTAVVIKGWDEGLLGMQVGEKRHLIVPPSLGYGERGRGADIPPNSTLEFDIELVGLIRQ